MWGRIVHMHEAADLYQEIAIRSSAAVVVRSLFALVATAGVAMVTWALQEDEAS